jgi:hypothetical protein
MFPIILVVIAIASWKMEHHPWLGGGRRFRSNDDGTTQGSDG